MGLSEFDLIDRYFSRSVVRKGCELGMGDDCAILSPEIGLQMAVTVDTLVEDVHFFAGVNPRSLGYKALAVSLSDLASMGAEPRYVTLALTIPDADECWLQGFSEGFFEIADQYNVGLIGGDTTRGPLSITIQAHGVIPEGQALLRSGAEVGDFIYVTGLIGNAGLALQSYLDDTKYCDHATLRRFNMPSPRVEAGMQLRNLASACIDISDGLLADLSHILKASEAGAVIELAQIPLSDSVRQFQLITGQPGFAVTAGDDYELCFTVPPGLVDEIERLCNTWSYSCACIGKIDSSKKLTILQDGQRIEITSNSYQHF